MWGYDMLPNVKPGQPVSAWRAADFNEVAERLNGARGADGCRIEIAADGGLIVRLGDEQYQWRTITTADFVTAGDGSPAICFRRVKVLCSLPQQTDAVVVPLSSGGATTPVYDEAGDLIGINFAGTVVNVEPCDSGAAI